MSRPAASDENDAGYELPPYSEIPRTGPKADLIKMQLPWSISAFMIAVAYSVLLLFSWIATAIATRRPLTTEGYNYEDFGRLPLFVEEDYAESQRLFDVAQVVGSIAYVLTIPVISTVFAAFIAVRLQRDKRRSYSLRQIGMLADRNWNSPLNLLAAIFRPSRHFSVYLMLGIILTFIGESRRSRVELD
jgi:hypothetical protein